MLLVSDKIMRDYNAVDCGRYAMVVDDDDVFLRVLLPNVPVRSTFGVLQSVRRPTRHEMENAIGPSPVRI
jgi:hypothetical protein